MIVNILSYLDEIAVQRKLVLYGAGGAGGAGGAEEVKRTTSANAVIQVQFDIIDAVGYIYIHYKSKLQCFRYTDFKCIFTIKGHFSQFILTGAHIVCIRTYQLKLYGKYSGVCHDSIMLDTCPVCVAASSLDSNITTKMGKANAHSDIWVSTQTGIYVYSINNNRLQSSIDTDLSAKSLHFSPNGQHVAAHIDSTIRIIETDTFNTIGYTDVGSVIDFIFSPDSTKLLIVYQDAQVLYDFSQDILEQLHCNADTIVRSAKFVNNDLVLLSTKDSTTVWNRSTKTSTTLPISHRFASLSSNGTHLVMSGSLDAGAQPVPGAAVSIYKLDTQQLLQHIPITTPHLACRYVNDVLSSCDNRVMSACNDGIITCDGHALCVWN